MAEKYNFGNLKKELDHTIKIIKIHKNGSNIDTTTAYHNFLDLKEKIYNALTIAETEEQNAHNKIINAKTEKELKYISTNSIGPKEQYAYEKVLKLNQVANNIKAYMRNKTTWLIEEKPKVEEPYRFTDTIPKQAEAQ